MKSIISLLRKECEKNFIEILDISKFIKGKSGNMKSNLCSIPNDVHPKTIITKFLFKEIFKKKFTNKNYYNWNSLLNLTFSNNFNFRIWSIPYIGETNSSFNRLVQYCNIKEKIANIITGFAIENDVSNYISFDSSEINLELFLGKDLFDDIKIYYSIEKKLKMAAEISNLVNRKEINTYDFSKINISKVEKKIIFFNLFEIKKKHYIRLIKDNISKKNCVFIFGNSREIDLLKKQKNLKEIQSISFDNRFLSKNLKKNLNYAWYNKKKTDDLLNYEIKWYDEDKPMGLSSLIKKSFKDQISKKIYVLRNYTCEPIFDLVLSQLKFSGYSLDIKFGQFDNILNDLIKINNNNKYDAIIICIDFSKFFKFGKNKNNYKSYDNVLSLIKDNLIYTSQNYFKPIIIQNVSIEKNKNFGKKKIYC